MDLIYNLFTCPPPLNVLHIMIMPIVKCKICNKGFYRKPSALLLGAGKYCSMACKREGQKTGKNINCFMCNKEVYKPGRTFFKSKSGKYFCGKSCQTIWRNSIVHIGPNHPNWRGGSSNDVYRGILRRSGQKQTCNRCAINDKRILVVHHLDHKHSNNKLENLVWLCHNCHFLIHRHPKEREKFMATMV